MIALITAMVPPALRLLANLQGQHSQQAVEKSVHPIICLSFVQIFLVVSLSAGIATMTEQLPNTMVPAVLAENLSRLAITSSHILLSILWEPLQSL
jgi:hypothetical protein